MHLLRFAAGLAAVKAKRSESVKTGGKSSSAFYDEAMSIEW